MAKKVTFGVAERVTLIGIFNQVKGDVETLQSVLEDVKQVSINEEEKKDINFREVKNEKGETVSFAWDKTPQKEIELQDKTVKFVLKFIGDKSKAEELSLADAPLIEINKKLKNE